MASSLWVFPPLCMPLFGRASARRYACITSGSLKRVCRNRDARIRRSSYTGWLKQALCQKGSRHISPLPIQRCRAVHIFRWNRAKWSHCSTQWTEWRRVCSEQAINRWRHSSICGAMPPSVESREGDRMTSWRKEGRMLRKRRGRSSRGHKIRSPRAGSTGLRAQSPLRGLPTAQPEGLRSFSPVL